MSYDLLIIIMYILQSDCIKLQTSLLLTLFIFLNTATKHKRYDIVGLNILSTPGTVLQTRDKTPESRHRYAALCEPKHIRPA